MTARCLWMKDGGTQCKNKPHGSGYCGIHSPNLQAEKNIEKTMAKVEEREAKCAKLEVQLANQIQAAQLLNQSTVEIKKVIGEIKDLPSLRRAELAVINGLIEGTIDAKAGGAISQMLKHQGEILKELKPDKEPFSTTEVNQINLHINNINLVGAWELCFDTGTKLENLRAQLRDTTTIDALLIEDKTSD